MALNVNNLTYEEAKYYYQNYLNGDDTTGIGEQVAKSAKWNGFLSDWDSDSTDYDIDQKNLKSGAAGTSLGLGAGSLLTSATGALVGGENSFLSGFSSFKKDGLGGFSDKAKPSWKDPNGAKNANNVDKGDTGSGPGSTFHAIMMTVSSAMGMASTLITQAAQKKSIADQNRVIEATKKEFEYDFNARMMQADEQKEFAAMQYENALSVVEENEGRAALSDAVSGALADSNQGLSEIAANQSSQIRNETGEELTQICDDIYARGGIIPNNVDEFSKKIELSELMQPYGEQAVSVDKQNKFAMYMSAGSAVLTGLQCVMGMTMSGVQYWNYILYGAALAMAAASGVIALMEAKKAAEAQTKAEMFAANSELLGTNARAATAEAIDKQAEYDSFAIDVANLSQAFGGSGGEVQPANSNGLA